MMRVAMQPSVSSSTPVPSAGGRLVAVDGRTLPLLGAEVRATASGGLARVTLEQRFRNPYDEPLRLTYKVPLPEDAAVSGYAFTIDRRTIRGVVEPRRAARERFDRALLEGRTAALLDEERGSTFTQQLGNVPPRAEIVCTLIVDQRLRWLDEGGWEWRFPTVIAPRFLGAPGRTPDAPRVAVDVADAPLPVRAQLALRIVDRLAEGAGPASPSHAITGHAAPDGLHVSLVGEEGVALDRDLVVRWRVGRAAVGISLATARPRGAHGTAAHAFGLVTVVAPTAEASLPALGRDLCLLLDTSGSMDGAPLEQARQVALALVDSLGDADTLQMIEFGDSARAWKRRAVPAGAAHRADARRWLGALCASGGTDMTAGILAALPTVREEAQRQVVLITDGQIGFEQEVLAQICARLPRASRLHTVGVGSAVNRSLTAPAARAGRGLEVIIGLDEAATDACARILRRTARPLVSELEVEGSALVEAATALGDLYAGAPALLPVALRPDGGELRVRGRSATGPFEQRVVVPPVPEGEGEPALAALFARERVAELELRLAAGAARGEIEQEIERLGLDFQIATRLTSFVAVSDRVDVDATGPTRAAEVPHQLPHGMSAAGLGLRAAAIPTLARAMPADASAEGALFEEATAYEHEADDLAVSGIVPGGTGGPKGAPPVTGRNRAAAAKAPPAPPPPRAPAPRNELAAPTLFRKLGRLLGRVARRLRGRVVRIAGTSLVIEIQLDAPLRWDVPRRVILALVDGSLVEATVAPGATTRAGEHGAGQWVRVVVDAQANLAIERAELDLPDGTQLTVALEEAR